MKTIKIHDYARHNRKAAEIPWREIFAALNASNMHNALRTVILASTLLGAVGLLMKYGFKHTYSIFKDQVQSVHLLTHSVH